MLCTIPSSEIRDHTPTHLLKSASISLSEAPRGALEKKSCRLSSGPLPAVTKCRLRAKRTWQQTQGGRALRETKGEGVLLVCTCV